MIKALFTAIGDLWDGFVVKQIIKIMLICIALILIFWLALLTTFTQFGFFELDNQNNITVMGFDVMHYAAGLFTILSMLGTSALSIALGWLSFPILATSFIMFFADDFIQRVESRHYPDLPSATSPSFFAILRNSLAFLGSIILLNLLLLPVYILTMWIFGMGAILFTLLNGWLIGREYYEMVGIRRLSLASMKQDRRTRTVPLLLFGCGVALLMLIPFIGLFMPILAMLTMTHLFHQWQKN